jgi:hypothetical protein
VRASACRWYSTTTTVQSRRLCISPVRCETSHWPGSSCLEILWAWSDWGQTQVRDGAGQTTKIMMGTQWLVTATTPTRNTIVCLFAFFFCLNAHASIMGKTVYLDRKSNWMLRPFAPTDIVLELCVCTMCMWNSTILMGVGQCKCLRWWTSKVNCRSRMFIYSGTPGDRTVGWGWRTLVGRECAWSFNVERGGVVGWGWGEAATHSSHYSKDLLVKQCRLEKSNGLNKLHVQNTRILKFRQRLKK